VPPASLSSNKGAAFVYDVGVKYALKPHTDLRFNILGKIDDRPHFGLPPNTATNGALYSPTEQYTKTQYALAITVGLDFRVR
jgi:hypothetical protein